MNKKKLILGVTIAAILIITVFAVLLLGKDDTETNQNNVTTPTASVMVDPTSVPTLEPTKEPTEAPKATVEPTKEPTKAPTEAPEVTEEPTPTAEPVVEPTAEPEPTEAPTVTPTLEPTKAPTEIPTPTVTATPQPTATLTPTPKPTATPTPTVTPKPTSTPTPKPTEVPTEKLTETLGKANVGEYVTFGRYEQDNDKANGKEPIEWLVLDKQDGKMLLLSKYTLDCKPYHVEWGEDVTWEMCTLRSWLNKEFYNNAFNSIEQSCIKETHVITEDNTYWLSGTSEGGNDTYDKLFLLSVEEALTYFNPDGYEKDPARRTQLTAYAKANGGSASKSDEYFGNAQWWLRTMGTSQEFASYVNHTGKVDSNGTSAASDDFATVRPALWVSIE